MKVNLLRNSRLHGEWLSVGLMIEDLSSKRVVLEAGDKLFVTADEPPKLSLVRDPPNLTLVQAATDHAYPLSTCSFNT